jgi:Helix-turn-helix domain
LDSLGKQNNSRASAEPDLIARRSATFVDRLHGARRLARHFVDGTEMVRSFREMRQRTTVAVSLGTVLPMLAITVIAALGSPKFACGDMSGLPISLVVPKEDRIASALTEHRRRALLPEPSRRRALRRHVGLSQGVIADALGVSPPTASRYEAG